MGEISEAEFSKSTKVEMEVEFYEITTNAAVFILNRLRHNFCTLQKLSKVFCSSSVKFSKSVPGPIVGKLDIYINTLLKL